MKLATRPARLFIFLAAGAAIGSAANAQVNAFWETATSGNWTDATRWSTNPNYPNNNGGTTYHAFFNATGAAYTVTLDANVAIDALTMNSADATLRVVSGGVLNLAGIAAFNAGSLSLAGGKIVGGTLNYAPGTINVTGLTNEIVGTQINGSLHVGAFTTAAAILDGVSTSGVRLTGSGTAVTVRNGLTLTGGGNLRVETGNTARFEGTQTFDGPTQLLGFSGTVKSRLTSMEGGTLTLGPSSVVTGNWGMIDGAGGVINQGRITSTTAGRDITITPASFQNSGILEATAGILNVLTGTSTAWSNLGGTLRVSSGGTINVGGTISTSDFGTMVNNGGTIALSGTLNNTGSVLNVGGAAGALSMANGGLIVGGTITAPAGTTAIAPTGGRGTLDGVTVNGNVAPAAATAVGFLTVRNGLTVNGALDIQKTEVTFNGTQTLSGAAITNAGPGNSSRLIIQNGGLTLASDVSLTAGPGSRTEVGWDNLPGTSIVNHGSILVQGSNAQAFISSPSLSNTGPIEVASGGLLRLGSSFTNPPTTWTNTGTLTVNGGTLEMAGAFSRDDVNINRTGGTIRLVGVMDNTGSVLTLDSTTGSWDAAGLTGSGNFNAAIRGGAVNLLDGQQLRIVSGGALVPRLDLESLTFNGGLSLDQANSILRLKGNIALNGDINVTSNSSQVQLLDNCTIDGGSINFDVVGNPAPSLTLGAAGSTTTIGPDMLIRGGRFSMVGDGSQTIINNGTIRADRPNEFVAVGGAGFLNNGVLEANVPLNDPATPAQLIINGVTQPLGTVRITNSTLLFGTMPTPVMNLERDNSRVVIQGVFDNVGRTFTLDSSTGSFEVVGGSNPPPGVHGGIIRLRDGAGLVFSGNPGSPAPTLRDVTLDGDLTLSNSGALLAFHGEIGLQGSLTVTRNAEIRLTSTDGTGTQRFVGGTINLDPEFSSDNVRMPIVGLTTAVLSPTTTLRGGSAGSNARASIGDMFSSGGVRTLVNQGLISSDRADGWLSIRPSAFVNEGIVEARDGGRMEFSLDPTSTWDNSGGVIRTINGGFIEIGGRVVSANLGAIQGVDGTIQFRSIIDNSNASMTFDGTTGLFRLSEGVVKGGVVNLTGGAFISTSGVSTLDGVTVNGNIDVTSSFLFIRNGLTLNGTARLTGSPAAIAFFGDQPFNSGTVAFESSGIESAFQGAPNVLSIVEIGENATIRGGNGRIDAESFATILNYGLVSADITDSTIRIFTARWQNHGTVQAVNGGIIEYVPPPGFGPPDPWLFVNNGLINLTFTSCFYLGADFEQGELGRLALQIGSQGGRFDYSSVYTTGSITLGGSLGVTFAGDYVPSFGDAFTLLESPSIRGQFAHIALPALGGDLRWDTSRLESHGLLKVVPSPGTLVPLGLLLVAIRRRRIVG